MVLSWSSLAMTSSQACSHTLVGSEQLFSATFPLMFILLRAVLDQERSVCSHPSLQWKDLPHFSVDGGGMSASFLRQEMEKVELGNSKSLDHSIWGYPDALVPEANSRTSTFHHLRPTHGTGWPGHEVVVVPEVSPESHDSSLCPALLAFSHGHGP